MRNLLILSLMMFAGNAVADYVPGRETKVALAKMQVVRASGIYEDVRDASLAKVHVAGSGFVRLELSAGPLFLQLPMNKFENTFCGDFAWSKELLVNETKTRAAFSDIPIFGAGCE